MIVDDDIDQAFQWGGRDRSCARKHAPQNGWWSCTWAINCSPRRSTTRLRALFLFQNYILKTSSMTSLCNIFRYHTSPIALFLVTRRHKICLRYTGEYAWLPFTNWIHILLASFSIWKNDYIAKNIFHISIVLSLSENSRQLFKFFTRNGIQQNRESCQHS